MKKSELFQHLITGILVVCAVVTTGLLVRRELFSEPVGGEAQRRVVAEWRSYAAAGHRAGPAGAPVTIVEFSDFQCPFCRKLATRLDTLRTEYPRDVTVLYRHAPLATHTYAVAAAQASNCAGEQGRFWEFHDALFRDQQSIGHVPWTQYAAAARIPDSAAFQACLARSGGDRVLRSDTAAAAKLGVQGTPTILINEQQLIGAPPLDVLRAHVRRAITERRSERSR